MWSCGNYVLFSIIIIIIAVPLYFRFIPRDSHCPRCKSYNVELLGKELYCNECGLTFPLNVIISDIDEDNILAEEEIESFSDAFKEFKDEEVKKKFLDALDKDFSLE